SASNLQYPLRTCFVACGGGQGEPPAADPTVCVVLLASRPGGQWRKCDGIVQVLAVLREHFRKGPVAVDFHRNLALDEQIELTRRSAPLSGLRRPFESELFLCAA